MATNGSSKKQTNGSSKGQNGASKPQSKSAAARGGGNGGKPNILIIWGDDIGWFNISAYNHGIMGYRTPSIDRIAREGAMFTDWYGQQSCTAPSRSTSTASISCRG